MMSRLTRLWVQNFRGICELDIAINAKNLLVLGENGTGKSSIVDAIEFFFTRNVEKLSGRADVKLKDCLSFSGSDELSLIGLSFEGLDELLYCMRGERVTAPEPPVHLQAFFDQAAKRPFILHRSQLTQFIEARPADRYTKLSNLIGMGEMDAIVNVWKRAHNDIHKDAESAADELKRVVEQIQEMTGDTIQSEEDILAAVNRRLVDSGIPLIETREDIDSRQNYLAMLHPKPEAFKRAGDLSSLLKQVDLVEPRLDTVLSAYQRVYRSWEEYLQKAESASEAKFETLLEEGQRLFDEDPYQDCPLCEQVIPDQNRFASRLHARLDALDELRNSRMALQTEVRRCLEEARRCDVLLSGAHALSEDIYQQTLPEIRELGETIKTWQRQLEAQPQIFAEPTVFANARPIARWRERMPHYRDGLEREIHSLTPNDEQRVYLDLANFLGAISENWKAWRRATDRYHQAECNFQNADIAFRKLVDARREGVQRIITQLEEDFLRLYEKLHPGEGHKAIQIIMMEERTSSAGLLTEMDGMQAMHPLGNYSEGHLDSLGLCIFLALIRRFNHDLRLIILDDVLTSIDAGHRMRVAQLVADEFSKYQIILTTHDEMWANQITSIFRNKSLSLHSIRMNEWDREMGASYDEYTGSDWHFYRTLVQEGRVQDAVGGVGRVLERFLLTMRRNLHLAVPATPDDRYTLSQLYPPFFTWLEKHPFERPGGDSMSLLRDEFDAYWQLRNWSGAHYNDWGATVSRAEALAFIDIVEALVDLFECPACGSLVEYDPTNKLLLCSLCRPTAQPRIVWQYRSDWVKQARRLLDPTSMIKQSELNAVNYICSSFERALQDARRRLGLAIPATPDDHYTIGQLYPAFIDYLQTHPREGIANWHNQVESLALDMETYLDGSKWLPATELQERADEVFETVCCLIDLISCPTCDNLLAFNWGNNQFDCLACSTPDEMESQPAYWYITT